jgi:oligosaccharide repeat unit polymerase
MRSATASPQTGFVDPIRITLVLWLFVIVGAVATNLNPLQPTFLAFVALGVGAHVMGMALCRFVEHRRHGKRHRSAAFGVAAIVRRDLSSAQHATAWLALLLAIGLLYFIHAYADIVPSLDAAGFVAARGVYLEEARGLRDKQLLYTTHLTLLGLAVLFFTARAYGHAAEHGIRPSRLPMNLLAIVTFLTALLTTGRTAPLLVILSYAFYCLRFRILGKWTIIAGFTILSLTMFVGVAFALGKQGLGGDDSIDTSAAMMDLARVYFFSAPVALQDVVLRGEVVSNACSNLFSYPIDLLRKFGFFPHCEVRELEFVFVPVATNVFTFIRAYWEDFGPVFPLALLASGFLIEAVHRRAFATRGYATFIFPFVLNAVLLQVFEEQLFANGSIFAYLTLAYVACAPIYRAQKLRAPTVATPVPAPA